VFSTPSRNFTKHKNRKTTHINLPSDCFTNLTKKHNPPSHDLPCNFNGLLQFFRVPNNKVLSHEMQANNTHIQTNPKHTLWEGFLVIFETSKLFIIPLINSQNQPLNWISTSLSTSRSGFSCTSIGDGDLIPLLEKPLLSYFHEKLTQHYLFVLPLIFLPFHCKISTNRTSLGNSLATQSSCVHQQHTHSK